MEEGFKPWLDVPNWPYRKINNVEYIEQRPQKEEKVIAMVLLQEVLLSGTIFVRRLWWKSDKEPFAYAVKGDDFLGHKVTEMKTGDEIKFGDIIFIVHEKSKKYLKILEIKE